MYNNNHHDDSRYNDNGSRRSTQSPFSEDNYQDFSSPFAEDNLEKRSENRSQPLSPQGKENLRLLQRFYITLIVTGVLIGGMLTWGVATLMSQWDMIDPPAEQQFKN